MSSPNHTWKESKPYSICTRTNRARKKTSKHKHFGRDGGRDKQEPSPGQMGPLPGTKRDPSLGQTGLSLFNSTVTSPFCPDGWGFVPGTIVPRGPSENCLCVLCLLVFFSQQRYVSFPSPWSSREDTSWFLKIDAFHIFNRTRNRTRTASESHSLMTS